ncbi:hypothetical protein [Nonomuraea aurantiaca]|uniref:hypothetical protein n=1 Tax=Nonomuraea aurantiaca TaxID=2878562 RepID=UPI001CD92C35|nr:hypothetical protein [Nonomuraea aurantiaca]MCA2221174.1 hypothetical protein [Nonomuraea aurantiaca]
MTSPSHSCATARAAARATWMLVGSACGGAVEETTTCCWARRSRWRSSIASVTPAGLQGER